MLRAERGGQLLKFLQICAEPLALEVGGLGSCLPPSVQDEQAVHDLRRGDAVRHGERPVAQEALALGQVRAGRLPAESVMSALTRTPKSKEMVKQTGKSHYF